MFTESCGPPALFSQKRTLQRGFSFKSGILHAPCHLSAPFTVLEKKSKVCTVQWYLESGVITGKGNQGGKTKHHRADGMGASLPPPPPSPGSQR